MSQVNDYIVKKYGRTEMPEDIIIQNKADEVPIEDLLSIFLKGNSTEDRLAISSRIIKDYGSTEIMKVRDPYHLTRMLGISITNSVRLIGLFELASRFSVPPGRTLIRGEELRSAA